MKLYYANPSSIRNFGDDLNPWIWERLLPGYFNDTENNDIFVGIGTLISSKIPSARKTAIFSSGVGFGKSEGKADKKWSYYYGEKLPKINDTFHFYCVRGPLSAAALGIPEEKAITDGAALIRRLYHPSGKKKYKFSYMPHSLFARDGANSWKQLCSLLGYQYIDPRDNIETVLQQISETQVLMTEAMHGAIVADALRVPWIPVHTSPVIYPFKWRDWCASLQLHYQPKQLYPYRPLGDSPQKTRVSFPEKKWFKLMLYAAQLCKIATFTKPSLSKEDLLETKTQLLEQKLQHFRNDIQSGKFA